MRTGTTSILLTAFLVFTSCNLFNSDAEDSDRIKNGLFFYTLSGITDAEISCDSYSLVTQWADFRNVGSQGEVLACMLPPGTR